MNITFNTITERAQTLREYLKHCYYYSDETHICRMYGKSPSKGNKLADHINSVGRTIMSGITIDVKRESGLVDGFMQVYRSTTHKGGKDVLRFRDRTFNLPNGRVQKTINSVIEYYETGKMPGYVPDYIFDHVMYSAIGCVDIIEEPYMLYAKNYNEFLEEYLDTLVEAINGCPDSAIDDVASFVLDLAEEIPVEGTDDDYIIKMHPITKDYYFKWSTMHRMWSSKVTGPIFNRIKQEDKFKILAELTGEKANWFIRAAERFGLNDAVQLVDDDPSLLMTINELYSD